MVWMLIVTQVAQKTLGFSLEAPERTITFSSARLLLSFVRVVAGVAGLLIKEKIQSV